MVNGELVAPETMLTEPPDVKGTPSFFQTKLNGPVPEAMVLNIAVVLVQFESGVNAVAEVAGVTVRTTSSVAVQPFWVSADKRNVADEELTDTLLVRLLGEVIVAVPEMTDQVVETMLSPGLGVACPLTVKIAEVPLEQFV